MPKKTIKISNFGGGLNNVKAERDIAENESPFLSNVEIEDEGRLKVMGTANQPYLDFNDALVVSTPGSGMFAFSHDFNMLSAGNTFAAAPIDTAGSIDYLLKENGGNIAIYDYSTQVWHLTAVVLDSSSSNDIDVFLVDGGLRISDRGNIADEVKYVGHIKRHLLQHFDINRWWTGDAFVKPFQYKSLATLGEGTIDFNSSSLYCGSIGTQELSDDTYGSSTNWAAGAFVDYEGILIRMNWQDNSSASEVEGDDSSLWTNEKSYEFWAAPLYDRVRQEGEMIEITGSAGGSFEPDTPSANLQVAVQVKPFQGTETSDAVGKGTTSGGTSMMETISDRLTGFRVYYNERDSAYGEKYLLFEADFEKGCKKAESSVYEDWQTAPYDVDGGGVANAWCWPKGSMNANSGNGPGTIFKDPPTAGTYESLNGHYNSEITKATWKTSAVAGRRVYIGNVRQGVSGAEKNSNDMMLKSPVNQFDKFPELNKVEAAVNDGDEIIRLESFGDRILQFKKRTLYIINVAGDIEFVENKHSFMGVDKHYQVCKTPQGIYWINALGLYWYNGEKIVNLSDGKIRRVRGTSPFPNAWSWTGHGSIGYDEKNHKIIILKDVRDNETGSGDLWVYNVRLNAWVEGKGLVSGVTKKTNWINTPDGELVVSLSGSAGTSTLDLSQTDFELNYQFLIRVEQTVTITGYDESGDALVTATTTPKLIEGESRIIASDNFSVALTTILDSGGGEFFKLSGSELKYKGSGDSTDLIDGITYYNPVRSNSVTTKAMFFEPDPANLETSLHYRIVDHENSILDLFKASALTGSGVADWDPSAGYDAGNGAGITQDHFLAWLAANGSLTNWTVTDDDTKWKLHILFTGSVAGLQLFLQAQESNDVDAHATTNSGSIALNGGNLLKWDNNPYATDSFTYTSKDIDFGNPATIKRIKKVYITFKTIGQGGAYSPSNVKLQLVATTRQGTQVIEFQDAADPTTSTGINYRTSATTLDGFNSVDEDGAAGDAFTFNGLMEYPVQDAGGADTTKNMVASLVPAANYSGGNTPIGDIYSCQVKLFSDSGKTVPAGFEINDITIVYREKSVK